MSYKPKTWTEKLNDKKPQYPKTLRLKPNFPCTKALEKMGAKPGESVVIVNAFEVDALMKKVPKGKLVTLFEICQGLAKRHKTKWACTLTAGIQVMIAAQQAEEIRKKGLKKITPYWRTLKIGGVLNEKFPGRALSQAKRLKKERQTILKKGKNFVVVDFEKKLIKV